MVADVDVFGPSMIESWIFHHGDGALIIFVDGHRCRDVLSEFLEKAKKPNGKFSSFTDTYIHYSPTTCTCGAACVSMRNSHFTRFLD